MTPRRDDPRAGRDAVAAALAALDAGEPVPGQVLRPAVRYLLGLLAERAPGRAVEVRIPPYAAVQCVAGPRHTRGTPPNVLETDAATWIRLATGRLTWAEASAAGRLMASGTRADVSAYLPVFRVPPAGPGHVAPRLRSARPRPCLASLWRRGSAPRRRPAALSSSPIAPLSLILRLAGGLDRRPHPPRTTRHGLD